jgi:hypothetical protein
LLDVSLISGPLWWALMVLGPAVLFVLAPGPRPELVVAR